MAANAASAARASASEVEPEACDEMPKISVLRMSRVSRLAERVRSQLADPRAQRGSHTPRVASIARAAASRSADASARTKLSYDSRSWRTTLHLLEPHKMSRFVLVPTVLLALFSTAVSLLHHYFASAYDFSMAAAPLATLSGTMSLLLAFRLNACYKRWWDARLLWGEAINGPRSLLTLLQPDAACDGAGAEASCSREQISGWSIAFALALKHHLRGEALALPPRPTGMLPEPTGEHDSLYRLLSTSQLWHLVNSSHAPLYALGRLRRCVDERLRRTASARPALEHNLFAVTESMLRCLTGCERIRKTPLPPGYVGVLRAVMLIVLGFLPFVLVDSIPFGNIGIVAVTSYILLEVEDIAVQMENPFGYESNDLPLDSLCLTVQADVLRLLDEGKRETQEEEGKRLAEQEAPSRTLAEAPRPAKPRHRASC